MTVQRKTDVFFWNSPPKIDDLVGSIMSWNCSCGYLMFNKECVHPRPMGLWCGAVKGTYHVTSFDDGVLRWPEDTGYAPSVQLEKSWSHSNRTLEMHFLYISQLSILHQPWKYWNCQRVPLGDVMSLEFFFEVCPTWKTKHSSAKAYVVDQQPQLRLCSTSLRRFFCRCRYLVDPQCHRSLFRYLRFKSCKSTELPLSTPTKGV